MGNPGVYIDGDPTQPPVCVCGCADGAWDDKAFPQLVTVSKDCVFCDDMCPADRVCGEECILCRAFADGAGSMSDQSGVLCDYRKYLKGEGRLGEIRL